MVAAVAVVLMGLLTVLGVLVVAVIQVLLPLLALQIPVVVAAGLGVAQVLQRLLVVMVVLA